MHKMNSLISLALGALIALAPGAHAGDSSTTVEVTPLKVEGLVTGNRNVFDAAFASKYNIAVPAPFEFIAPTSDKHLNFIKPAPGGTGIFKVFFTTLEKQVKSNLQFVPIMVAEGETSKRLESLQSLLKKALVASVPDANNARINIVQNIMVGKYPAIEMLGNYKTEQDGPVVIRLVAIPNPDGIHEILAIINGLAKNMSMTQVSDIMKTDSSRALGTFRFK